MNITLNGTKIIQDSKTLAFEKNNGVDVINITVDTDESWSYKLDVKYPEKCCTGEELYNIIDLNRDGDICSVELTSKMLPFAGKYTMQLRAINGDKVKHSDTFDAWIKYSIEPASTYDPVPSEFYQIEDNITEINNNPPKPGENGYWLIWDVITHQYKESAIPLPDGTLPEVTADTSGKYLSNDGKKAYWAEVQAGTEGKIDKIEVNNVEQPIINKTVNIAVPTKTSDLSNDSGYITNEALNSYATKAELPTKVSQLENDSEYITALGAPVQSVNGKTGDVVLTAVDVGALPSGTKIPNKTSDLINDSGYITESAVPTKTSELINDSGYVDITAAKNAAPVQSVNSKTGTVVIGKTDVGLGNVDNVKQYSISNPPPYPVTSVNGQTGDVTIEVGGNVDSVNGKTGAVVLSAADIGALPNTTVIPDKTSQLDNDSGFITSAPVTSVNTKIGAVTLSAADVSAIPSTLTGTAGQVLTKTADGQEWKDVDIPNALPNPNALTFTGAVTGNYDGSEPLTVEIPSGGSGGGGDVFELIGEATSSGVSDAVGLTIPFDGSLYKTIIAYAYNLPAGNKKRIMIRKSKTWHDGSPLGWNEVHDTYLSSMTKMNNTWGFFGVAIDVCGKLFTLGAAEANTNSGHGYFRFWPQNGALPTLNLSNCKFISLDCNSNSEILPDGCSLVVWGVRK